MIAVRIAGPIAKMALVEVEERVGPVSFDSTPNLEHTELEHTELGDISKES